MSFMNPVDMVEEDAADLQFPKARTSKKKGLEKVAKACITTDTAFLLSSYNPLQFNSRLEKELQYAESREDLKDSCSIDHECVYCHVALQEPYVKCADCSAELCLQCFSKGSETKKHKNNHAYIIVKDDIQVFQGNWTAREERVLLNTLQTQGYGNWEAVAKALKYKHTEADCRQHYHDNYFGGIFERLLGLPHASQTYMPETMPYVVKMRSVDPPRHDDISSMQFKMMAGYRAARGDFDTPYDVTAESLLTTILEQEDNLKNNFENDREDENTETDSCIEELKLAVVRAFNHRLKERQRRYKIMRDHGLIMPNRCLSWITKYSSAFLSEHICKRFLIFMQLCEPMEFDLIMEGVKYFSDLQKAIFRLYELRQNGVRTMVGGSLYFKLKKKRLRNQRERAKNERLRVQYDWRKLVPNANESMEKFCSTFFLAPVANTMPRKKAAPMDVYGLPGFAKLNDDERRLCSVVRIVPQAYLDYKNILVTENAKCGHLRLADARRLIKIDVNKTRQIYDFLIEHGHINKPN